MNVLVVLAHPRRESFSGAVADALIAGLRAAGHRVEVADLHGEGFAAGMPVADEPDWDATEQRFSLAVLAEQARIERNDALVLVFPVWWWSLPAILKGWIDRVWNKDWAYGSRTLAGKRALMLGIAATGPELYARRGYAEAMRVQLEQGILRYCGIGDGRLRLLYGSLEGDADRAAILAEARAIGADLEAQFATPRAAD
jgi:NAD(P)H dehydrogenase (quinone)